MAARPVGRPKGVDSENAKRRRQQLMDAAVASIVEHGVSSTTLATVAKASGLSQGTAVFYFKTKEMLLSETFQHRMDLYRASWTDAVAAAGDDPVDRIIAMAFASLEPRLLSPDDLAFWNAVWPEAARLNGLDAAFKAREADRQRVLSALCQEAARQMRETIWSPRAAAQAIETMIEGVWVRLYYSADHLTLPEARTNIALLLASIFPSRRSEIRRAAR